ncbi:TetR family transcriptional regulator [Nocardia brasiliensis]|uniref:TetR family transcriptional regulator n=1 Tax=Nocardia brasiliensis TaxID=37326 RepID=A0A6G9XPW8_NOCBR|nr:TetR/AcrR family transcriptional regulator [Nocardia brasiliensis]QIS02954.1 TetR family transcriptional regulator [Nocardia brasiliensis]
MTEAKAKRRADAERSRADILAAATRLLADRPEVGLAAIAAAAGVTRQTVYAHFASREELLHAVVDHTTARAVAAMDAADLDSGTATEALLRMLDVGWQFFRKSPGPEHLGAFAPHRDRDRHVPVEARLLQLIQRGCRAGEFDTDANPQWLVAAIIAVSHAAGEQVRADHMSVAQAQKSLRDTVVRLVQAH